MDENQTPTAAIVRPDASRIAGWLMVVVVVFAAGALVMAVLNPPQSDSVTGELLDALHRHFNPGLEANLATWFSTGLLLTGALLTALVARAKAHADDPMKYHWMALSLLILFMSMDEAGQIHEMLNKPTQQLLGVSKDDWWVWTLPALVAVIAFVVVSFRLLAAQSQRTRRLMILAFGLFVLGAFGIEAIGGILFGVDRPLEAELTETLEEFFEMSGAVVFIYAMLDLLASIGVEISFTNSQS
jgi:hypothetical protein